MQERPDKEPEGAANAGGADGGEDGFDDRHSDQGSFPRVHGLALTGGTLELDGEQLERVDAEQVTVAGAGATVGVVAAVDAAARAAAAHASLSSSSW